MRIVGVGFGKLNQYEYKGTTKPIDIPYPKNNQESHNIKSSKKKTKEKNQQNQQMKEKGEREKIIDNDDDLMFHLEL